MHSLEINHKTYLFASKLEELTKKEYLYLLQLAFIEQSGHIKMADFRTFLIYRLLHIRKTCRYYLMSDEKQYLIHENIISLAATLDSFFESKIIDGKESIVLRLDTFKNLIPSYDGLIGPADALTNCSFFVYKEAFNYFLNYAINHDENDLNRMIATLYRPQVNFLRFRKLRSKWDGSAQQPLTPDSNPDIFNKRVRKISKWPAYVKTGIELYFSACVDYLRTGRPTIDGAEIDFSILYSSNKETGPSGIGITGLLYSLAESKVFGNIYETSNTNLYDVLVRLYQLKLDYEYQISKFKKND